jgi:hypothetical protein
MPCATPTPAFSSKPASRSSPSLAGSGMQILVLPCVHTLTSCPTQAREVTPPWMLGSVGRRTPWKPPDGHVGVWVAGNMQVKAGMERNSCG